MMNRSTAMFLIGCLMVEMVPFGSLFVVWAIVAAIPVLVVVGVYLLITTTLHCSWQWVTKRL